MRLKKKALIFTVLLLTLFPVLEPVAQETGTIQARATVIPAMLVSAEHDLLFGMVFPDIDKSVDKADIGFAGEWRIQGNAGAEITVDFTLPTDLLHTDSATTMTIDFANDDASFDDGTGSGQSAPTGEFNPHGLNVSNLGAGSIMDVWIGGTVRPSLTQTGGDYVADIVLTAQYTGI